MQSGHKGLLLQGWTHVGFVRYGSLPLLAAYSLFLCSGVSASESVPDMSAMPMVLTPARMSQSQGEVPGSVTVIDRELIEASGAREIYQVMQLVPGMTAVEVDGNIPTVSYHGTQARDIRRMLVLIDGRSMYQPGLARVEWNNFPLTVNDIERIEVTRGPAAAAYGANAFSAVINIISRDPRDVSGTTVTVREGGFKDEHSNGVRDVSLTHALHKDNSGFRVTASRQQEDGYDALFEGLEQRNDQVIENINLRYLRDNEKTNWEWLAGASKVSQQLPRDADFLNILSYTDLPSAETERAFLQFKLNHDFSESHGFKANLYVQHQDAEQTFSGCMKVPLDASPSEAGSILFTQELRDFYEFNNRDLNATLIGLLTEIAVPGSVPSLTPRLDAIALAAPGLLCPQFLLDVEEQRAVLELQNTFVVNEYLRGVLGLEIRHDKASSDFYLNGSVSNLSSRVFGNLEFRPIENVTVNAGGYAEKDEINGRYFSPRVGVNWQVMPGHFLRAVHSRAIRSPDIYEKEADLHLLLLDANGAYATDPVGLLGWSEPEFAITQASNGAVEEERIKSTEFGYFGRWRTVEWDLRYFTEELDNLISGDLNLFEFSLNNNGAVDIEGREAQLSWRPHPAHLLRGTAAHIHTDANIKTETRIAAQDMLTFLWRYDFAPGWMWSTAWYQVDMYQPRNTISPTADEFPYERVDANVSQNFSAGGMTGRWFISAQHKLSYEHPVVFPENEYQTDTRYWLGLELTL